MLIEVSFAICHLRTCVIVSFVTFVHVSLCNLLPSYMCLKYYKTNAVINNVKLQGINLYIAFVRVFTNGQTHFYKKCSLFAFGKCEWSFNIYLHTRMKSFLNLALTVQYRCFSNNFHILTFFGEIAHAFNYKIAYFHLNVPSRSSLSLHLDDVDE